MQRVLPNLTQFSYFLLISLLTIIIHIVLVEETWFDYKVTDDLVSIDNYTLFRLDRNPTQKRKGGGICFYVRNDLKCSIIKHRNISEPNVEYITLSSYPFSRFIDVYRLQLMSKVSA